MKLTKQQAICLKLAQWLGKSRPHITDRGDIGFYGESSGCGIQWQKFNPFATTTEGRAQFAECRIKADMQRIHLTYGATICRTEIYDSEEGKWSPVIVRAADIDENPAACVATTLEAIFYAIGGTVEELQECCK